MSRVQRTGVLNLAPAASRALSLGAMAKRGILLIKAPTFAGNAVASCHGIRLGSPREPLLTSSGRSVR